MFWKNAHDFFKWMWPAIFGGLAVFATVVIAAAGEWPEAKIWASNAYAVGSVVMMSPLYWAVGLVVFLVWLFAFIWSGNKSAPRKDLPSKILPSVESVIQEPSKDSEWGMDLKGDDVSAADSTVEGFPNGIRIEGRQVNLSRMTAIGPGGAAGQRKGVGFQIGGDPSQKDSLDD